MPKHVGVDSKLAQEAKRTKVDVGQLVFDDQVKLLHLHVELLLTQLQQQLFPNASKLLQPSVALDDEDKLLIDWFKGDFLVNNLGRLKHVVQFEVLDKEARITCHCVKGVYGNTSPVERIGQTIEPGHLQIAHVRIVANHHDPKLFESDVGGSAAESLFKHLVAIPSLHSIKFQKYPHHESCINYINGLAWDLFDCLLLEYLSHLLQSAYLILLQDMSSDKLSLDERHVVIGLKVGGLMQGFTASK